MTPWVWYNRDYEQQKQNIGKSAPTDEWREYATEEIMLAKGIEDT